MAAMTRAPALVRSSIAALLTLLLAARLLSPAGFMPAFDHGAVTIVVCPDAGPSQSHHHPATDHKVQQHCPYAAASALGALPDGSAPVIAAAFFAAILPALSTLAAIDRQNFNRLPPPTGPPAGS